MKKVFLFIFSLIMMFSVSFGIAHSHMEMGEIYTPITKSTDYASINIANYTPAQIHGILNNMTNGPTNTVYIQMFEDMLKDIDSAGLDYVANIYINGDVEEYWLTVENPEIQHGVDFAIWEEVSTGKTILAPLSNINYGTYGGKACLMFTGRTGSTGINSFFSFKYKHEYGRLYLDKFVDSNCDIYLMHETEKGSKKIQWDGASYYYKEENGGNTGDIPEDVTDLTDEQIAEIVERFINSNARLENMPHLYNEYFITYDTLSGYYRAYTYMSSVDLAIEYGNYDEEGNFITSGTEEGEAWQIRPYVFEGNIFERFNDWISYKRNEIAFRYFSISPDTTIEPRYIGTLEYNYCSNYKENEVVIYSSKQIRYVGEETNSEGETEIVVTDNYIPPTVLKDSVTGEEIIIKDNLQDSSNSLENVITPNADFSGLKEAFDKYISFVNISSIVWLTTSIFSMISIFVPYIVLGVILFLINRVLNGGS